MFESLLERRQVRRHLLGRLTADDLGLAVKIYDPVENYRKVRNKWFGTHANTVD